MAYDILQLMVEDHDNLIHIIADRHSGDAMVVDPAWDADGILQVLDEEGLTLTGILITHSHHDHINAVDKLYVDGVTLFVPEAELPYWPDCPEDAILVTDGDEIAFASTTIGVIATPGHTAGSTCYHIGQDLLVGDTLFVYGAGRTTFPGSSTAALYHSLQKLKKLPDHTRLWVGHHYGIDEETTLGAQLAGNPFLMIDNETDFIRYRDHLAAKTRSTPYAPITPEALQQVLQEK